MNHKQIKQRIRELQRYMDEKKTLLQLYPNIEFDHLLLDEKTYQFDGYLRILKFKVGMN